VKKLGLLILMSLYISSFSGVLLNLHYCGGKLSLVRFFTDPQEKDCCGDIAMDDCCHNHSSWHKIETAHTHSFLHAIASLFANDLNGFQDATHIQLSQATETNILDWDDLPPLKRRPAQAIYTFCCVFRI